MEKKKTLFNLYAWKLKDVILVSLLAVFFAIICMSAVYLAMLLTPVLVPFGLGEMTVEFFFGIWFFVATFSPYIMRKPGVAVITSTLTGVVQVLMGSPLAATVVVSAFWQGVGSETAFLLTRYKKFNIGVMLLAAVGSTVFSFVLAWYRGIWADLSIGFVAARFIVRLMSALLFAGIAAKLLADRLAKTGVLKSYPIGEKYVGNIDEP
ncbi:MAG: ECF transporter S component [Treponema sp.]|nr:ECF transporter S component [Treponema sp.]